MREAVAREPQPTPDIVDDPEASAAFGAVHDVWAVGVSLAAGRICRWAVAMGADYDFCPPAPKDGE